jgi:hypothetical protein
VGPGAKQAVMRVMLLLKMIQKNISGEQKWKHGA